MSKYQVNGLPWRSGIGTDVRDCKTAAEVMEKSGLNFQVEKCPIIARMPFGLGRNNDVDESIGEFSRNGYIYRETPNAFATYRTDYNVPLGLVKQKYEVIQNTDAFNFFNDAIGEGMARWDRACIFGHGHKILVSAKLPNEIVVGDDKIDDYLVFSNSHDGSSSINILFTPIRCICTNMLNSALRKADSYIRIRHTQSAKERLSLGAQILNIATRHAKDAEEFYQYLYTVTMSDAQVMKFIADLQLTEAERQALTKYDSKNGYRKLFYKDYSTLEQTGISNRKANILSNMFEYYQYGIGQQKLSGTAWGAYNAVTGFYSNVANLDGEKRCDSLLYGSAYDNMLKALNSAYEFACEPAL